MDWITSTLYWYIHLFVIGLLFLPITKRLFRNFVDQGYAFSKTLGIIVLTYLTFVLGVFHLTPFTQVALYSILAVCGLINLYLFLKDPERGSFIFAPFSKQFIFIFEELLFLGSILLLAYIRGQEPSIHGLEKFMDFGFINSALKSKFFPPLDMWYSAGPDIKSIEHAQGYAINYYYFGHLSGAVLIKITGIASYIGYNLILATIFAQGVTLAFSLITNIVHLLQKSVEKHLKAPSVTSYIFGILGSYILNLGGNLHTIYLFTKGYANDTPVPFWQIFSSFNPTKYWYPNATRFIPFTIHEFPSYSYVVADLHGHVFDIPFVLLTIAVLFHLFYSRFKIGSEHQISANEKKQLQEKGIVEFLKQTVITWNSVLTVFLGFMCAVHYMTNAFDGPIYLLLTLGTLFIIYRFSYTFLIHLGILLFSYVIFSFPFTSHFSLFISGIGVDCPPDFMFNSNSQVGSSLKLGPFLFEKGNCQKSPLWMLFTLWGFFWTNFIIFLIIKAKEARLFKWTLDRYKAFMSQKQFHEHLHFENTIFTKIDVFMLLLFLLSTFLLIIPEFFYVKDIYPAHFRANTMFKLGYQAFIMMSIASTYVIYRVKHLLPKNPFLMKILAVLIFGSFIIVFQVQGMEVLFLIPFISLLLLIIYFRNNKDAILAFVFIYIILNELMLVAVYPFFSFPSYYTSLQTPAGQPTQLKTTASLDGQAWLQPLYPEDLEIINFINSHIKDQPVILEAQGDSYTDYDRISSYTGLPTVSGWWVHEWLWRGSADVVGKRIPDINAIYESNDISLTKQLLKKYHVKYVVISEMERKKYPNLNETKFNQIGKKIFESSNGFGALYQVD